MAKLAGELTGSKLAADLREYVTLASGSRFNNYQGMVPHV